MAGILETLPRILEKLPENYWKDFKEAHVFEDETILRPQKWLD